jgi:hypothetical protein
MHHVATLAALSFYTPCYLSADQCFPQVFYFYKVALDNVLSSAFAIDYCFHLLKLTIQHLYNRRRTCGYDNVHSAAVQPSDWLLPEEREELYIYTVPVHCNHLSLGLDRMFPYFIRKLRTRSQQL